MSGLPKAMPSALGRVRDYHRCRGSEGVIALATAGVSGRSVFISYRRQLSWPTAELIRKDLIKHDCDVFLDTKNLDSGEFDQRILREITARKHFIVLLEPGSLDRICEPGDWLRREIAHALCHGRNIVPVTANGFEFRPDLELPPDVERLPSLQAVRVTTQSEYFNAAMKLLRKQFLKIPSNPTASKKPTRFEVPVLSAPQLTSRPGNHPLEVQLAWSEVSGAWEYMVERAWSDRNQALPTWNLPTAFVEVYRGQGLDNRLMTKCASQQFVDYP
jgi:hypothetical protein